ncbi:hypothetical protein TNCV_2958571 [Trichonephila clavipes]|nr:hypothetical protein TNCV_2958571 [Trichonephila clavipes]
MDIGNGKCLALSNASAGDCRAMFNSTRRSGKRESLAGAAGTHGSSVSRFNTGRLLVVGIFEISRVSIRSMKSVGTERCDPQRSILHTSGHVALSAVAGFVTVLNVFSPCGGGHVEHILV